MTMQKTNPLMLLVRGLPGSGKSYLAAELAKHFPSDRVVQLDPDAIDFTSEAYQKHVQQQIEEGVDTALHPYRYLRAQAYQGIKEGKIIIWNQPFTNLEIFQKMTANFNAQAVEHDAQLRILVVEVMLEPEVAKARVTERKQTGGHGPSDATFTRFVGDYSSFATAGYDTVTVQGDADVTESVETILKAIG